MGHPHSSKSNLTHYPKSKCGVLGEDNFFEFGVTNQCAQLLSLQVAVVEPFCSAQDQQQQAEGNSHQGEHEG